MTLRNIAIALAIGSASVAFVGCNSTVESDAEETASAAVVRSFSFSADDNVAENLDSVFFSIDLVKGLIFNADSLPFGANVTKLVPVITYLDGASVAQLNVNRSVGGDTVYNYLTNSTDSIDFTNPVTLRLVSPDGMTERNYTIRVNVHTVKADSLAWGEKSSTVLPSLFAAPSAQRTVRSADNFYCLTRSGNSYSMAAHTGDISDLNGAEMTLASWTKYAVTLPAGADMNTLAATDDALFLLTDAGLLWRSTDGGRTWQSTGRTWHHIYGGYGSNLLGSVQTVAGWQIDTYPAGTLTTLPDGMPVDGTSVPVSYTFPMSDAAQMLIVGGRTAAGTLTGDTWGYDGQAWARISRRAIPVALTDIAVAPYFTYSTGNNWVAQTRPTLVAMGGRDADGKLSSTVYISDDYGFNWRVASDNMQLPEFIGAFADAQAYVCTSVYKANVPAPAPALRISRPTESWDCPFIYLFGGVNAKGQTNNVVWRGVINRMTFRPVE